MAGAKKKKKPAANPARGFATTSVASSKARAEPAEGSEIAASAPNANAAASSQDAAPTAAQSATADDKAAKSTLSPEEYEKQLEEDELQLLVEKYAQKTKRDAQRQRTRLETDRRLLRNQADSVNSRKWLPQELMDQVLDLIQAESRFASSSVSTESSVNGKMLPEEELTMKLWTLQQTLASVGFPDERVQSVIRYILDIAPNVPAIAKDSLWGLEEALDWLARECPNDELPDYEGRGRHGVKPFETPGQSPLPSGATTPRALESDSRSKGGSSSKNGGPGSKKKKAAMTCDSDIEPDDLLPVYLETKAKLFELERGQQEKKRQKGVKTDGTEEEEMMAKLRAKIGRIEKDVLFDRFPAEQQWKTQKIVLEKQLAEARKQRAEEEAAKETEEDAEAPAVSSDGDVNDEAARIAAEVLGESNDDDDGLADLFANLPVTEVDAAGKSTTVVNGADGVKITIRDFGKWAGVTPMRALEEACRARDASVKIAYRLISEVPFANRHSLSISWTKAQETPPPSQDESVDMITYPTSFNFAMKSIATPDKKQSEAYVATWALFHIFGISTKEEKVGMRLPAVWRELWDELALTRKSLLDSKDREAIRELRALVRQRQDQELEDGVILQGAFKGRGGARNGNDNREEAGLDAVKRLSGGPEYYQNIWAQKSSTPRFQMMLQSRMQLPMWNFKQQVTDAVDREQVVIICGETGCGKSTQVPAFLLEHQLSQGKPCKIYCTEPRRISAISLAKRVSEELGEGRGDLGTSRSLVGYSIRLEANTSRETRLVYATTGIVMRMLEGSNDLREVTHLVLDEVHERTIDSDFLLIILKKLMLRRKDLKVVLMSATVDADRFSKYLGGAPVLTVPGRTFPVQVRYLEDAVETTGYMVGQTNQEKMVDLDDEMVDAETDGPKSTSGADLSAYSAKTRSSLAQMDEYRIDFDLIVQLIAKVASDPQYVAYSNAILVFLPGIAEIRTLNDLLSGDPSFASNWLIYPLHSTIATEDQEAAFLVPPPGIRKVVLATNIAETGITIPDVTCVIDTGKHREMRFDERRQLSRLIDTFISRANAKQRRGRAGRVQEGLCFHLFTKHRHDTVMSDQQTPEMLRLSLQDLAIRVKICKIGGIEETLSEALDPPSAKNIRRAVDALIDVRALTMAEDLTPLGHQLARLPLDVFLGKLILMGAIFKCLDMAITVAAILSSKTPFTAPFGQRGQADLARRAFRRGDSDLLTVYNAYLAWKRVCQSTSGKDFQFCRKNFLSQQTLANIEDLKGQLLVSVADSGFLLLTDDERRALNRLRYGANSRGRRHQNFFDIPQRVNTNSENDAITTAVIAWSFYPKLLVRDAPGSRGLRNVGNNQSISLHPSSVNKGHNELKFLSYYHIMQAKSVYHAHETTAAEPFAIALLCGDVRADMFSGVLVLDGNRCRFALPDWKTMLVIKVLRTRLRELLTRSFKQPGKLPTAQHERWLAIWQRIFSSQQQQQQQQQLLASTMDNGTSGKA
ncbi:ATP dependent RNA [Colletotrichum karsti]|uniref:RNA helicase n=1 Tax=Colletotrichum karsti TaxID=1095194 RepID=A0A9P6IFJ8_9PEZI|nr:ATP dependent RNA [Colletotrichum karsti]KAF9882462.1 ATP dependent RNA [Colletotrichum karsti]